MIMENLFKLIRITIKRKKINRKKVMLITSENLIGRSGLTVGISLSTKGAGSSVGIPISSTSSFLSKIELKKNFQDH